VRERESWGLAGPLLFSSFFGGWWRDREEIERNRERKKGRGEKDERKKERKKESSRDCLCV